MEKVKFSDIIKELSEKHELSQEKMKEIVYDVFDKIKEVIKNRMKITIPKFGTFLATFRKGGERRNPLTGGTVVTEDKHVPKFQASDSLKEEVK